MITNTPRSSSERIKLVEASLRAWQKRDQSLDADRLSELAIQQDLSESIVQSLWLEIQAQNTHEVQIIIPLEITTGKGARGSLSRMRLVLIQGLQNPDNNSRWITGAGTAVRLVVRPSFEESLHRAREALNALDPSRPIWPNSSAISVIWHCEDLSAGTELSGGSAGCIIALGLVELFRKAGSIPKEHRLTGTLQWRTGAPLGRITASAQLDSQGYLTPVNGEALSSKMNAEGVQRLEYFFVSRAQRKEKMGAAAASGSREVPVGSLQEALWFIAAHLGEQPGLKTIRPVRWKRWAVLLFILVPFGLVGYDLSSKYPFKWVLNFNLPHDVAVDVSPVPEDCAHTVSWPADSDYIWRTRIWPVLQRVRAPLALVLGSEWEYRGQRPGYELYGFGELSGVHSLALLHSEVANLQGAENLQNIVRFVDIGSRVTDLVWLANLSHLKILVLDSGFLQEYPYFDFSELETLVIHVPDDWDQPLNVGGCPKLKRLAICGNGLKEIQGLENLSQLEELVIYSEKLEKFDIAPSNHITHFELARAGQIDLFDLGLFPNLKSLVLTDTSLREIHGQRGAMQLETIEISETPDLKTFDLEGLVGLRELSITDVPLEELKGLSDARSLRSLRLNNTHLTEIVGLSTLRNLDKLALFDDKKMNSLPVNQLVDLRELSVSGSSVNKVDGLGELVRLRQLIFRGSPLSDIVGLERLTKLETIDLSDTSLSDIPHLINLKSLSRLDLSRTQIHKLPVLGTTTHCWVGMDGTPFQMRHPEGKVWHWTLDKAGQGSFIPSLETDSYEGYEPLTFQWQRPDDKVVSIDAEGWEVKDVIPSPPIFLTHDILASWGVWESVGMGYDAEYGGYGDNSGTLANSEHAKPVPRSPLRKLLKPSSNSESQSDTLLPPADKADKWGAPSQPTQRRRALTGDCK